jgi:Ca2+-binding RTX toxin-like protein
VDGLTDATIYSVSTEPSKGIATVDAASGEWSYTPNANTNGGDSFVITVTDDLDGSTTQDVTITVNAQNIISEFVNLEIGNEESTVAIQISPESISETYEAGEVFVFDKAVFDAINVENSNYNFSLPIEIDTELTDEKPVNIVFNIEEERQILDTAVKTNGGGTVASNAPTGFDLPITGVYFNSGAGDDSIGGSKFNDFIRCGIGDDIIDSGAGADLIRGGSGNDVITSGLGADIIYYTIDQFDGGIDTITDFSSEDVIQLSEGIEILSLASDKLVLTTSVDGESVFLTILASGLNSSQVIVD